MKHRYQPLIVVSFFFVHTTNAQAGDFSWFANINSIIHNSVSAIATDDSDNVYITGLYGGPSIPFGDIVLYNTKAQPYYDIQVFIAKYNKNRQCLWAINAANGHRSTGGITLNKLAVDKYGGVYVTGGFNRDSLSFKNRTLIPGSPDSISLNNYFIARYNANGDFNWVRTAANHPHGDNQAQAIATDKMGYVYVSGYFESDTFQLGPFNLYNTGRQDVFIGKYDTAGNVLWAKNATGEKWERPTAMACSAGGDVYVTGAFASDNISFGSATAANSSFPGQEDVFLARYTTNGDAVWLRTGGGQDGDWGNALAVDKEGGAYVSGSTRSPSATFDGYTLQGTNYYIGNMFVVKYDSTGDLQWLKGAQIQGLIYVFGIVPDNAGQVYVAGLFPDSIKFGQYKLDYTDSKLYNGFFARYNAASGDETGLLGIKDMGYSLPPAMVGGTTGQVYLTSNYDKELTLGGVYKSGIGTDNIFIAELAGTITGVPDIPTGTGLVVFPNPTTGTLHISTTNENVSGYSILNSLGQVVNSAQATGSHFDIPLNALTAGLYFLQLNAPGQSTVAKFIKE